MSTAFQPGRAVSSDQIDEWIYAIKGPHPSLRAETIKTVREYLFPFVNPPETHQFRLWETIDKHVLSRKNINSEDRGTLFPALAEILKGVGLEHSRREKNVFGTGTLADSNAFDVAFARKMAMVAENSLHSKTRSLAGYALYQMQHLGKPQIAASPEINAITNKVWLEGRYPQNLHSLALAFNEGRIPQRQKIMALMKIATALTLGNSYDMATSENSSRGINPKQEAIGIFQYVQAKFTPAQRLEIIAPMFVELDFGETGLGRVLGEQHGKHTANSYRSLSAKFITTHASDSDRLRMIRNFVSDFHDACLEKYEELYRRYGVQESIMVGDEKYRSLVKSIELLKAIYNIAVPLADRPEAKPRPEAVAAVASL